MDSIHEITVRREDIADAIFDALTLYCVENGFIEIVKKLDKKQLKEVQTAVEKILKESGCEIN